MKGILKWLKLKLEIHFQDSVLDTRTVTKVTEKSIWMKDASGNTYRVKNTGANGYYMPILKGFTLKNYFTFDAK